MRILISPAKKMREDAGYPAPAGLPRFLPEAERLLAALRARSAQELQAIWKCNDAIARQNVARVRTMDLCRNTTPAVLAYVGIQYQYLAPGALEGAELAYLQEHLRILSGFYGLLRPLDGVTPYRLEMGAKLPVYGAKDLYGFWGDKLAAALAEETDTVIDLASREYSRAVEPHLPGRVRLVRCTFGERQGEKLVEKGTVCKMARGEMVRWMARTGAEGPEDLRAFAELGYRYDAGRSGREHLVFLKEE